jgi:hypothetical protein
MQTIRLQCAAVRITLLAALMVPLLAATGCTKAGSTDAATRGWCKLATERRAEFDTTHVLDARALSQFAKIEAQAPAEVRGDLHTVRTLSVSFRKGDAELFRDPTVIPRLVDAIQKVNRYLRTECHARILFPNTTTTT